MDNTMDGLEEHLRQSIKEFYLDIARDSVEFELDKAVQSGATIDDITQLINYLSQKYLSRKVDNG